jgi:hypothetical protein
MRREATSAGRGRGAVMASAVAAIATALGSWAMQDVGPQLLEHARQAATPRRDIDFAACRQRNEIETF